MIATREELALAIDEAHWEWVRAHLERGGIILISNTLELADAATKVANDDTRAIEEWIQNGLISKPSETQITTWDADKQKRFSMLIVSPYILIQERLPTFH